MKQLLIIALTAGLFSSVFATGAQACNGGHHHHRHHHHGGAAAAAKS